MSDSIGSVSVEVVPDARGFSERLKSQLRDQQVEVKANADTEEANAELDKTARTRTAKIKTDVSQLSQGASKLDQFVGNLGLLPSLAIAAGAALVPLGAAIGGVVAAIGAPLAIAGGGATLFAFLGGAAIAQTEKQQKKIDALAKTLASAKASLSNTQASAATSAANSLSSAQASAAASLKSAQQALAHAHTVAQVHSAEARIQAANAALSARTSSIQASQSASVAAAQRRVNQATTEYKAALAGLSPQQKGFLGALQQLKDTFTNVLKGPTGKALLGPFTEGLTLVTYTFRAILPIVRASAGAFTSILEDLNGEVSKPQFGQFVHTLAQQVAPDIEAFAHIGGNAIKGLAGILGGLNDAFGGPHNGVIGGLEQLSGKFADLGSGAGHSKWLTDFVAYFHQVGPGVADTLKSLARAFGHIVAALAPLGPGVLGIIKGLADQFNRIPIGTLTILGKTIAELVIFQKLGGFKAIGFLDKKGLLGRQAVTSGLGAEVAASAKPVPVIVTNWPPGFGGKGAPGAPVAPVPTGPLAAANAEAALASRSGGILSDGGIARILAAGLLRKAGPALLGVTAGDIGNEVDGVRKPIPLSAAQKRALAAPFSPAGTAFLKAIRDGVTPTATAYDALKAHAAAATRELDLAGPHIHQTMAGATDDVNRFAGVLNSIKDKRIKVIADTADAIRSLERLQALRIHDKFFNVYQVYNGNERAVGPGGGIGMHNVPGSAPRTSGSSGGGASTGRSGPLVYVDRMEVRDSNDILRQSQNRLRARAGGGVSLLGAV